MNGMANERAMATARAAMRLLIAVLVIGFAANACVANTTVVMVRHGEKDLSDFGQLLCRGLNRSLMLGPVLLAKFGVPDAIYAPIPDFKQAGDGPRYIDMRSVTTIEPFAIQLGQRVHTNWYWNDAAAVSDYLARLTTGLHVCAWEHSQITAIAKALIGKLGGDPAIVPIWQDDDFDSIYIIRFGKSPDGSQFVTFDVDHEDLNGLPIACPALKLPQSTAAADAAPGSGADHSGSTNVMVKRAPQPEAPPGTLLR